MLYVWHFFHNFFRFDTDILEFINEDDILQFIIVTIENIFTINNSAFLFDLKHSGLVHILISNEKII